MSDFAPDSVRESAIEKILSCKSFALIVEMPIEPNEEDKEARNEITSLELYGTGTMETFGLIAWANVKMKKLLKSYS